MSIGFGTEAALRRIGLLTRGLGGGGTVPVPFPLPLPRRELVPLGGPRYFPRPFFLFLYPDLYRFLSDVVLFLEGDQILNRKEQRQGRSSSNSSVRKIFPCSVEVSDDLRIFCIFL